MDTSSLSPAQSRAIPEIVTTPEKSDKKSGFSFGDFLDVINPLQHIPVISTVYRKITGDDIDAPARLAGGTLFGGVLGLAAAGANTLLDKATGKDMGEHVLALFSSNEVTPEAAPERAPAQSGAVRAQTIAVNNAAPAVTPDAAHIPTLSPHALQSILTTSNQKSDDRGHVIPNDQLLAALQKANESYRAAQAQKMGWSMPSTALPNANP